MKRGRVIERRHAMTWIVEMLHATVTADGSRPGGTRQAALTAWSSSLKAKK
jgi:hypothetical protein